MGKEEQKKHKLLNHACVVFIASTLWYSIVCIQNVFMINNFVCPIYQPLWLPLCGLK